MVKILLFDFSRVLLFPTDDLYTGSLNNLYKEKKNESGFIFTNYFKLNDEILIDLKKHSDRRLVIFTSETIQDAPEIKDKVHEVFDTVISAIDLGKGKKDPGAYTEISIKLGASPSEILFIDDSNENLIAASHAGLTTYKYINNDELIRKLSSL